MVQSVIVGGETRGEGGVELGSLGLAGLDGEVGHDAREWGGAREGVCSVLWRD